MLSVRNNVRIAVLDRAGPARSVEAHNLVTTTGIGILRALLDASDTGALGLTHGAIGTGSDAVTATDTALGSEVYRAEIGQYSPTGDFVLAVRFYVPSGSANGSSIQEAALFGGENTDLFARVVFDPIAKTSSVALSINWDITIGAS